MIGTHLHQRPAADFRDCHWHRLGVCAALSVVLLAGCEQSSQTPDTETADAESLHAEIERGPVLVELDVVPREPQLSDEPVLTLTIAAEEGVDVTLPDFGDSVGGFVIRGFREPLPEVRDGKQILKQIYTLEALQAGTVTISPFTIQFTDNRSGSAEAFEVVTDPLPVEVATMIESEAPSLDDLLPPEPPQPLQEAAPDQSRSRLIAGLIAAIVVVLIVLWLRIRRKEVTTPPVPPEVLARRELDELISSKLSTLDVKEFFVRLTAIVRRYIERTTTIRAPEQTTEEFLREISQREIFAAEDNERLRAFLESADLVKFAGYTPDNEAIKQSTHRAKQFIELKSAAFTESDDIQNDRPGEAAT